MIKIVDIVKLKQTGILETTISISKSLNLIIKKSMSEGKT